MERRREDSAWRKMKTHKKNKQLTPTRRQKSLRQTRPATSDSGNELWAKNTAVAIE